MLILAVWKMSADPAVGLAVNDIFGNEKGDGILIVVGPKRSVHDWAFYIDSFYKFGICPGQALAIFSSPTPERSLRSLPFSSRTIGHGASAKTNSEGCSCPD